MPRCYFSYSYKSIYHPTPYTPLIDIGVDILGIVVCSHSIDTFVLFRYPSLIGVSIISLCPAVIYPNPNIIIGVIEITVIMMIEVYTSKHIVDTDRQLSRELLFMLTAHNLFFIGL